MSCAGILHCVRDFVIPAAVTICILITKSTQDIQELICRRRHFQVEIVKPLFVDPEIPVACQIRLQRINARQSI